ncbi:MAG TPA: hypothetical protein VGR16_01770 [Thermomicrobiales bacterium]|nr:hypothetical protein [Thermomicrobiales bacterium]
MDIFEDLGGCAVIGIIVVIILLLLICVAIVVFGVALSDITG